MQALELGHKGLCALYTKDKNILAKFAIEQLHSMKSTINETMCPCAVEQLGICLLRARRVLLTCVHFTQT